MKALVVRASLRSYEKDGKTIPVGSIHIVKVRPPEVGAGFGLEVAELDCAPFVAEACEKEMKSSGQFVLADLDVEIKGRGQYVRAYVGGGQVLNLASELSMTPAGIVPRQSAPARAPAAPVAAAK